MTLTWPDSLLPWPGVGLALGIILHQAALGLSVAVYWAKSAAADWGVANIIATQLWCLCCCSR